MTDVVVIYDLKARDGRSVIEARLVLDVGDGQIYGPPKATFYSCAYDTQLGRLAAFNRVVAICAERDCRIVTYQRAENKRAFWQ